MEQGLKSTKTAARPSHEAIENKVGKSGLELTEQEKIDQAAMKGAKRAGNRILADEGVLPEDTMFTK